MVAGGSRASSGWETFLYFFALGKTGSHPYSKLASLALDPRSLVLPSPPMLCLLLLVVICPKLIICPPCARLPV